MNKYKRLITKVLIFIEYYKIEISEESVSILYRFTHENIDFENKEHIDLISKVVSDFMSRHVNLRSMLPYAFQFLVDSKLLEVERTIIKLNDNSSERQFKDIPIYSIFTHSKTFLSWVKVSDSSMVAIGESNRKDNVEGNKTFIDFKLCKKVSIDF